MELAAQIKSFAKSLGFDLVGIADASPSKYRAYYRQWLDDGQAATMEYLHKRFEERTDPACYLPDARAVVCVALNYHVPLESSDKPAGDVGKIARYALGDDYHEHIKSRLHKLADFIRHLSPDVQTRCGVDTAPIMEKELAARAGIGWVGKHTCVINPAIGSWLMLGEVVTTLDLAVDEPATDRCGTCRRCIDACPTDAITAEYQLDARRCISFLTIENRGEISAELQAKMNGWLFGCDICQDVCPWNSKAVDAVLPEVQPRFPTGAIDLDDVMQWDANRYQTALRHSAMKRVKLPILQRNAATIRGMR